ncbi:MULTISPECIES: TetR/AcrR family transcriptional regulator [unclassified Leucobacter]|uniref:TetR/AcrR family transcriptional regulator n=1 Tax=unclassified Leucobacter TaxID=2621730 RepID=UPI003015A37D
MEETKTPQREGLRARKRRATENAIETSAVKLALEHGVEHVTVEAICEMADISRSTFFNYFAGRDYAIVGRAINIPEGDAAFGVLDSCPDNLTLGILRLVFAAIGHSNVNTEVARLRAQLLAEQPEAARLALISMLESAHHLTTTATAWLIAHPEHAKLDSPSREATMAASLAHGVISAQLGEWMQRDGDIAADEDDLTRIMQEYRILIG